VRVARRANIPALARHVPARREAGRPLARRSHPQHKPLSRNGDPPCLRRQPRRTSPATHSAMGCGRHTLGQRLTAMGPRLFGSATEPNKGEVELSWRVRQHVLRDYHAANLAAARTVSEELVCAGFNTGGVPYCYRARQVQVTPAGGRARWRARLLIEPVEASTVRMIFVWRGEDRLSTTGIRRRLTAARYSTPLDPTLGNPVHGRRRLSGRSCATRSTSAVRSGDAPTTRSGLRERNGSGRTCGCTSPWLPPRSSPPPTGARGMAHPRTGATDDSAKVLPPDQRRAA